MKDNQLYMVYKFFVKILKVR